MHAKPGDFMLPGDKVVQLVHPTKDEKIRIKIGPGLICQNDEIIAIQPGKLLKMAPSTYWLDCSLNRYIPCSGDQVVGIVRGRTSDSLKVDIGSTELALLPLLSFESATKRNKPDVSNGDTVYANICLTNKNSNTLLTCVTSRGKSDGLGLLPNSGFLILPSSSSSSASSISFSTSVIAKLFEKKGDSKGGILEHLGKDFAFEITIGMNGFVWFASKTTSNMLKVYDLLRYLDKHSIEECQKWYASTWTIVK